MLKITNGKVTLFVTPGAYRDVYAPQGFTEVTAKTSHKGKIESKIETQIQPDKLPEVTPEDVTASEFDVSGGEPVPDTPDAPKPTEDLSEYPSVKWTLTS